MVSGTPKTRPSSETMVVYTEEIVSLRKGRTSATIYTKPYFGVRVRTTTIVGDIMRAAFPTHGSTDPANSPAVPSDSRDIRALGGKWFSSHSYDVSN